MKAVLIGFIGIGVLAGAAACASPPPASKVTIENGPTLWSRNKVKSIKDPSGTKREGLGAFRGSMEPGSTIEYENGVTFTVQKDGSLLFKGLTNLVVEEDGAIHPGAFIREFD